MAILRRHKSTVYGLQADLDNLGNADTTETSARIQAVNALQTNIDNEATARTTAVSSINTTLTQHTTSINSLETRMNVVNGDVTTAGSIAKTKADLQSYTDTRETAITTAYRTYADQAEVDAVASAKSYTDTRETAITTAYQTYADQAEVDAKSYTDTGISALSTTVSGKLSKSNNLSDLSDVAVARTNLGVYSQAEVQAAIDSAALNLGSNFSATDIAARNAMQIGTLTVGDNIFVTNDGDTKWAIYKVTAITDGAGSTSTFEKIMDEDVYLNANTASAIKSAYESNDNTNAYTDADKLSVSASASALSTLNGDVTTSGSFKKGDADTLSSAKSYTDTRETAITTAYKSYADQAEADAVVSAKSYTDTRETAITTAYQTYADQAEADAKSYTSSEVATLNNTINTKLTASSNLSDLTNVSTARTNLGVYSTSEVDNAISVAVSGTLGMASENVVVHGDLITVSHIPVNGVILNFATVRYVDENGNSFDIPVAVTATAGGKEFTLNADSTGQFDTKTVKVQYMYEG